MTPQTAGLQYGKSRPVPHVPVRLITFVVPDHPRGESTRTATEGETTSPDSTATHFQHTTAVDKQRSVAPVALVRPRLGWYCSSFYKHRTKHGLLQEHSQQTSRSNEATASVERGLTRFVAEDAALETISSTLDIILFVILEDIVAPTTPPSRENTSVSPPQAACFFRATSVAYAARNPTFYQGTTRAAPLAPRPHEKTGFVILGRPCRRGWFMVDFF